MKYDVSTVEEYMKAIPSERRNQINQLRDVIQKNIPPGFEEDFQYGMIAYVVPLSRYKEGYHAKKDTPLPFISLASQKNNISVYHMGLYANEELNAWFEKSYKEHYQKKPNMGKSCIRFKEIDVKAVRLIGELARKMTVEDVIALYQ